MVDLGIYGPGLVDDTLTAPQECVKRVCELLTKRGNVNVTLITHSEKTSPTFDNYCKVSKKPLLRERGINNAGFDVVYFYKNADFLFPVLLDAKTILRCHGDLHWEIPRFSEGVFRPFLFRVADILKFGQYDSVVFVSKQLENRMVKNLPYEINSTTVYNGLNHDLYRPREEPTLLEHYSIDQPYIYHTSNFNEKKNPFRILKAFKKVSESNNIQLVISGGRWEQNQEIHSLIEELGIQDSVNILGYVPEEHLPVLYSSAAVFVFPSLHETFGLPIIESLACGTPVVASNRYSVPEIAGSGSLIANPTDPDDIAKNIINIINDSELRTKLSTEGQEWARSFQWEKTAEQIEKIVIKIVFDTEYNSY